ncbi:MAG: hypothetical protein HYU76_11485 [Betaproteobacteria bacterium]|nr:hypothetical protein [Betaproteobacteria bacterium]
MGPVVVVSVRMSVHPLGAVITAEFGRTAMDASMTSPSTVPVGLLIVRVRPPDAAPACAEARKAIVLNTTPPA